MTSYWNLLTHVKPEPVESPETGGTSECETSSRTREESRRRSPAAGMGRQFACIEKANLSTGHAIRADGRKKALLFDMIWAKGRSCSQVYPLSKWCQRLPDVKLIRSDHGQIVLVAVDLSAGQSLEVPGKFANVNPLNRKKNEWKNLKIYTEARAMTREVDDPVRYSSTDHVEKLERFRFILVMEPDDQSLEDGPESIPYPHTPDPGPDAIMDIDAGSAASDHHADSDDANGNGNSNDGDVDEEQNANEYNDDHVEEEGDNIEAPQSPPASDGAYDLSKSIFSV